MKEAQILNAIVLGMERAQRNGLHKPHDVAISVKVALGESGYVIQRRRKTALAQREEADSRVHRIVE